MIDNNLFPGWKIKKSAYINKSTTHCCVVHLRHWGKELPEECHLANLEIIWIIKILEIKIIQAQAHIWIDSIEWA